MAKAGSWSATDTSAVLIPALKHRRAIVIQLHSGDPIAISVGRAADFSEGTRLLNAGDWVRITGEDAGLAIYGVCDTGNSAVGGSQI